MISHKHKAIYFHIGKTAGTSVEKLLLEGRELNPGIANHEVYFGYDSDSNIYLQHATAKFIKKRVLSEIFDDYYKFSIVRNPYERLVSVYHYLIDQHTEAFGSFEAYIKSLSKLVSKTTTQKGSHHLPQTAYTHINGNCVCEHIAQFELLPQSFDPIRKELKINASLGKHNTGRFYQWQKQAVEDYYQQETIDIVSEVFKQDFLNFGYSFDPKIRTPISPPTLT